MTAWCASSVTGVSGGARWSRWFAGCASAGPALERLAGELKRLCGAGGTVKDGRIEVQGDHRERVAEWLRARAYTVKLAGG